MKELLAQNLAHLERRYRCDDHVVGPHFLGHSIFQLNYSISLISSKRPRNSNMFVPKACHFWF